MKSGTVTFYIEIYYWVSIWKCTASLLKTHCFCSYITSIVTHSKHNTLHTLFELPPILSQFKQLSLYCCVCVHSILDFTALENVKVVRFNVFSSQRLEQHVNRKASLSLTNNGLHTKPHKTHSYILLAHFSLQWIVNIKPEDPQGNTKP